MSYVESHAQHFEGRILVSGQRSEALQASTPETNRNGRNGELQMKNLVRLPMTNLTLLFVKFCVCLQTRKKE